MGTTAGDPGTDGGSSTGSEPTAGTATVGGSGETTGAADVPPAREFRAVNENDFALLPDNADFTNFQVEGGERLQIPPLREQNFPNDLDYCSAGSDAELNAAQQWARARLGPSLEPWTYRVQLTVYAEEDGESPFAVAINGAPVAELAAPSTDEPGVADLETTTIVFQEVSIAETDTVEIWAKAHSNLALEEGAECRNWSPTFAWARGRWVSVRFEPLASP